MTEAELRAVLLWRAVQPQAAAQGAKAGPPADAGSGPAAGLHGAADLADDWAGQEARRRLGEQAAPTAWLAERARLALGRLAEQQAAWRPLIDALSGGAPRTLAPALLGAAALAGLAAGSWGGATFVNLLAPPLLGLLAWNIAVYALLAWRALHRPAAVAPAAVLPRGLLALAARGQQRLARGLVGAGAADAPRGQALAAFHRDWWPATAPLQRARAAALVHAAAAVLALALLAAWYGRGLVLDFRAGWDSTFLQPGQVRALLQAVLGPAAALTGLGLPDAEALARLRAADGGGESAARWIHLWAVTVLGAVVLPRAVLAGTAAWRARRLAASLPLPDHDDLQRLVRSADGRPLPLAVLPYSYQLDPPRQAALQRWLVQEWGPLARPQVQPSLPLGAEDRLPEGLPPVLPPTVVVLFALTATPEHESHAAFLRALAARRGPAAQPLVVLVDESGFRERLSGDTLATRLAQRRAAWQALAAGVGLAPRFIDLAAA